MKPWPSNNCLMCDMPWKNNRVCYEGAPPCPQAGGETGVSACLCMGEIQVRAMENGDVVLRRKTGKMRWHTQLPIQKGTMAADVASHTLYFSAGYGVQAMDLDNGNILWSYSLQDTANSPMLFERLGCGGEVQLLLCASDAQGFVYVLNRESGELIWQAETGFPIRGVAAHRDGRLYVACDAVSACLDAANGDAIWVSPIGGEEGLLKGDVYLVGGKRIRAADGTMTA